MGWSRPYDDWKNTLFYLGAGILICAALWKRRRALTITLHPVVILPALYIILCAVTIDKPVYEGWLSWARIVLWTGLVWALAQQSREQLLRIAAISTLSAAAMVLANWFHLHIYPIWPHYSIPIISPVGHISYYADFLALHLPFAGYFLLAARSRRLRAGWGSVILILLFGLWMTSTRSGILAGLSALGIGAMACVAAKITDAKKIALGIAALVAFVAVAHWLEPKALRSETTLGRFAFLLEDRELGRRLEPYRQTLKMIEARPWAAWGLGTFRFVHPEFSYADQTTYRAQAETWLYHPHNEILHQGAETGVPGLVLFLTLWGSLFVAGWRTLCHSVDRETRLLAIILLMGIAAALTSWQVSTTFLFPLIRLVMALVVALGWHAIGTPGLCRTLSIKKGTVSLIGVAVAATIFLTMYHAGLYGVGRATKARSANEGLAWTDRAYRLAPGAFDPLLQYVGLHGMVGGYTSIAPAVRTLQQQYPFVPVALFHAAKFAAEQGNNEEARDLLGHALVNSPDYRGAQDLLDRLR